MTHAIDTILSRTFPHASWLFASETPRDVIVALSEALGPMWGVYRETDCEGDVSIIVLPLDDDAKPAFVLYERGGAARVATIAGDDWEGDRGYSGFQDAVAAIITVCSWLTTRIPSDLSNTESH
jgi:hypothetical protein